MTARKAFGPWARALVLLGLLFGPLVLGELWTRRQLDLVYPHLATQTLSGWIDLKLMLLERAGCPRVLALGSSQTINSLSDPGLDQRKLEFDGRLEPVGSFFNFGLHAAQASLLYGVWRQIQARDCTPDYVLLEISPTVVRERSPWPGSYAAVLDLETLWSLPPGFREYLGVKVARLIDYATTNRLLLRRLRDTLVNALTSPHESATLPSRPTTPALDGQIVPTKRESLLTRVGVDKERRKRRELQKQGIYDFQAGPIETTALHSLVDEIAGSGAQLVLHTPPVSMIYHELIDPGKARPYLEGLRRELLSSGAVEGTKATWVWCYFAAYDPSLFFDWIHLNEPGASRYANALFATLARPSDNHDGCQVYGGR